MKKNQSRLLGGGLLILAGVLLMLQQFNFLGSAVEFLWMILFAAGAAVFLWIYFSRKDQWWAVIPGLSLLGLALIFLEEQLNLLPGMEWSGAVFLGCIGLAFWLVYLRKREHWWPIIPGGVLITLALIAGLEPYIKGTDVIFFLGLAATFSLVALLPGSGQDTRWAFIPAGILAVIGIALLAPFVKLAGILWPLVLVAGGIIILIRAWK
jgi:hypothetical protein